MKLCNLKERKKYKFLVLGLGVELLPNHFV